MPHIEILQAGEVERTIITDAAFAEAHYPGAWRLAAVQPADLPAPAPRHLSKRAFRARFTKAERAAVEWAAVDKPEAPTAERLLSAQLRADLKDLEQAEFIYLEDPDVLPGLQALEAAGILAAGRADAIYSAPVLPSEAP